MRASHPTAADILKVSPSKSVVRDEEVEILVIRAITRLPQKIKSLCVGTQRIKYEEMCYRDSSGLNRRIVLL